MKLNILNKEEIEIMADEIIKDKMGRTIAILRKNYKGDTECYDSRYNKKGEIRAEKFPDRLVVYDAKFNKLGYYEERYNTTYDTSFRQIGKGNLLLNLLGLI